MQLIFFCCFAVSDSIVGINAESKLVINWSEWVTVCLTDRRVSTGWSWWATTMEDGHSYSLQSLNLSSSLGSTVRLPHVRLIIYHAPYHMDGWLGGVMVSVSDSWRRDREVAGSTPGRCNNSGQVVNTRVPLSPSSIIWYRPKGDDALRPGR